MMQDIQGDTRRLARLRSGMERTLAGDLDGGAAEFAALLAEQSRDAEALNNLAIVYRRQDKLQDALGNLLEAIDIDPTVGVYHYNLGKVYRDLGNFKSAAMAYGRAVESDPDLIPAYVNLGASWYLLQDWNRAERFLRMGLSRCPEDGALKRNYAAAKAALEAGGAGASAELEEAEDLFAGIPSPPEAALTETAPQTAPAEAALPEAPPAETAPQTAPAEDPLSPERIRGLLRYLRRLSSFAPPEKRLIPGSGGLEKALDSLLSRLGEEGGGADQDRDAGSPGENTFPHITRILNYLENLAACLPESEERNRLTGQVASIIGELEGMAETHAG
ncbi:MAG: tetratricopeptide repeat protein [Spirochaetaceae bacterium]|jgi:tetratricopeptide (TPR) repeat protein|nr:tetratricopeptide repeat protein [Spirochaetaceae bacterium]